MGFFFIIVQEMEYYVNHICHNVEEEVGDV